MKHALVGTLAAIILALAITNVFTFLQLREEAGQLADLEEALKTSQVNLTAKEEEMRRTVAMLQQESSQLVMLEQQKRQKAEQALAELRVRIVRKEAEEQAAKERSNQFARLETVSGRVYTNVVVTAVDAGHITIMHVDGGARIPLDDLLPELRKRFEDQLASPPSPPPTTAPTSKPVPPTQIGL